MLCRLQENITVFFLPTSLLDGYRGRGERRGRFLYGQLVRLFEASTAFIFPHLPFYFYHEWCDVRWDGHTLSHYCGEVLLHEKQWALWRGTGMVGTAVMAFVASTQSFVWLCLASTALGFTLPHRNGARYSSPAGSSDCCL